MLFRSPEEIAQRDRMMRHILRTIAVAWALTILAFVVLIWAR